MRLTIGYDVGAGSASIVVTPLAIIGYEKANRTKISKLATDGIGIGDMAELAYRQLELEGRVNGSLEDFQRQLVDVEVLPSDDPT